MKKFKAADLSILSPVEGCDPRPLLTPHSSPIFYRRRLALTFNEVKTMLHYAMEVPYNGDYADFAGDGWVYFDDPRGMVSLVGYERQETREHVPDGTGRPNQVTFTLEGWLPRYLFYVPQHGWTSLIPQDVRSSLWAENWRVGTEINTLFLLPDGAPSPRSFDPIAFGDGWRLFCGDRWSRIDKEEALHKQGAALFFARTKQERA